VHVVNLIAVPHSGLHTMRRFFMEFNNFHEVPFTRLKKNSSLIQTAEKKGLSVTQRNLVWGQIITPHMTKIKALAENFPTVIPMRDPLLSVISAAHANPVVSTQSCAEIIKAWAYIFADILEHDPFVLALDLIQMYKDRYDALDELITHVDLNWCEQWPIIVENNAVEWPEVNAHGGYPLKLAYYNQDFDYIKQHIPQEVRALQECEPLFRPFLEGLGYSDLLWFSTPTKRRVA